MKIAFWNTWYARAEGYQSWAEQHLPIYDFANFSEMHSSRFPAAPRPKIPMPDQFERLSLAINTSHLGHFSMAARASSGAAYGLAMFHHRKHPPFALQTELIHGEYGKYWSHPRVISSCSLIQSYIIPTEEGWLIVSHIHGLWMKKGKVDSPERDQQSCRIVEHLERRVNEVRGFDKPVYVILGGDFNYRRTMEALEIVRCRKIFGSDGAIVMNDLVPNGLNTRTWHYPVDKATREADYILVSPALVEQFSAVMMIDRTVPSDHALLSLEVTLKPLSHGSNTNSDTMPITAL
jgi:exonuclease III